ncbi:uncharacterized protein LOC116853349 isoform X2 [Odontomachus brunneus]|uniref:uncharacterized protein LOC116853349 isoform X2 n=1 Tax=Odontomachus brunneus TaxID=486640 RepID=UPI0013F18950|nr:uncharacterized protein LOC116853349 isoform X2 [Odontomachus brunneus]
MVPLTSPSRATATMVNNNTEYYSFYVNVYIGKFTENKEHLLIPSGQFLTQDNLRQKLYDNFGIGRDSRISYIDDDGDDLPIDSEYEFQEALKLAKTSSPSKGLVLVVRPWKLIESNSISDMEQCDVIKQERDVQNTMKMMFSCISNISTMTQSMTNMVIEMNERQRRFIVPSDTQFQVDDSNASSRQQSSKVLHADTSPPPWFIEYMESMKKEIVSTVTQEVVKQMTEMLNKRNKRIKSFLSNETKQSKRRSHSSLSKRYPRCFFDPQSKEKNQKRMNAQDEGHFSDASIERVDEPQDSNVNAKDHDRQLHLTKLYLRDLDGIKGQLHKILKEKRYYRDDEMTNNLDMDTNNKQERRQSIQNVNNNNVQEDITSPICNMTSDALKILDGELRMNCSITGNRALNIDSFHENTWCDDLMEDIDKISYCSGCSIAADEREHVDTFVIVEMPMSENANPSLTQPNTSSATELQHRDSRDSPSFELLSETSSPRSSLYVKEGHFVNVFSAQETNLQMPVENPNPAVSSTYMVDIHGKIYNEYLPTTPDTNVEFEKRSDGVYSFVTETLPVREADSSKSANAQQQTFSEQKNSQYNATSSNDDERNQLPSYSRVVGDQHQSSAETFYWRTHSQSKIDTNDFMQSFHSHTTSVTDNNNDLFDKTKNIQTATMTSGKATRHSVHDKRSSKIKADETRNDSDKFNRSQQSSRTSGSNGCSNESRRTFGEQLPNSTADPVLILPETLLTMAAQVGSIAYVTARDMFDKLRSHAEDPVKRRRMKLNTATDNCSSSSATRRPANQS